MSNPRSRPASLATTALILLALAPLPGKTWDVSPRIGVGTIYSDNINQAPRGEEESELVLQVVPGVTVSREGGRFRLDLSYSARALVYTDDSDRNTVFHRLGTRAGAELVDELLFLDADASYSQRLITTRPNLGVDPIVRRGNFSDVLTYRISPFATPRIGSHADTELRYQRRVVDHRDATRFDSTSDRVTLQVDSGAAFRRFGWELRYDREEIDYDDDSSARFETYSGLLRFDLTDQISVFGQAGREDNAFDRVGQSFRPSGSLWRVGAIWTPTTRTRLEGFYADRYFGSFFGAALRHRFRHSTWAFDYQEEPTTLARLTPGLVEVPFLDEDEQPFLDEDGNPVFTEIEFPELTTESYLRRRGTLAVQGQRSRIGWGVRAFQERREFEFSERDEEVIGAGVRLNYRVAPRTQLAFNYDQLRTKDDAQPDEEHSYRVRLGLQYTLAPRTALRANYQFLKSDGIEGVREPYEENRVTLFLNTRF